MQPLALVVWTVCVLSATGHAWSPTAALFAATSNFFTNPFSLSPPWWFFGQHSTPPQRVRGFRIEGPEDEDEKPRQETTKIRRLVSAAYKGRSYVMVENLTLPFEGAEQYCRAEFSKPMHLTSVHSDEEWEMLNRAFGQLDSSGVWLGGAIRHPKSNVFLLTWLDHSPVDYHRFAVTERERWISNWRVNKNGCIVTNLDQSKSENWTAVFAPCTEPRAFVCKESKSDWFDRMQDNHNRLPRLHHGLPNPFNGLSNTFSLPSHRRWSRIRSFDSPSRGRQETRFRVFTDKQTTPAATAALPTTTTTTTVAPVEEVATNPTQVLETATTAEITAVTNPASSKTTSTFGTPISVSTDLPTRNTETPVVGRNESVLPVNRTGASPGAPPPVDTPSTRIIRTLPLVTRLQPLNMEVPPGQTPKFTVLPVSSQLPSAAAVVRVPILKSNAQVIYPQSIWDLA